MSVMAERVKGITTSLGLTQDDIAAIVGASTRTVNRWWSGEVSPQRPKEQRLRELAYVGEQVARVLKPEQARDWLFMPNRLLDHDAPADRIERGDYRTVLALIEALAEGFAA